MRATRRSRHELDGLRLLGLSRIPRCARCARLRALVLAHEAPHAAPPMLPPAPHSCRHTVCAPLAARYRCALPEAAERRPRPAAGGAAIAQA